MSAPTVNPVAHPRTVSEWNWLAVARARFVHTPSGQAGNLVAHRGSVATIFLRWERLGAVTLPVFERFPKAELTPESEASL